MIYHGRLSLPAPLLSLCQCRWSAPSQCTLNPLLGHPQGLKGVNPSSQISAHSIHCRWKFIRCTIQTRTGDLWWDDFSPAKRFQRLQQGFHRRLWGPPSRSSVMSPWKEISMYRMASIPLSRLKFKQGDQASCWAPTGRTWWYLRALCQLPTIH